MACLVVIGFGMVVISDVSANATINVNTTDDELNNDGDCSLREAIRAANTDTAVDGCDKGNGSDRINVPFGTYTLSINGQGEDNTATGDLDILDDLTIIGAGMDKTIIDGGGIDRVFHLVDDSSCSYFELTVSDLTIQNGDSPDEGSGILSDRCWQSRGV